MIDTNRPPRDRIAEWLRLFLAPGQVTEIRCLPARGGEVCSGFFDFANLEWLAREADLSSAAGRWTGVYFVPNPIKPAVLARRPNMAAINKPKGGLAKDADIDRRRWLFADVDPVRAKGHEHDCATDEEKARALVVADAARAFLRDAGFPAPLVVDSGNGWHLYYPSTRPTTGPPSRTCSSSWPRCTTRPTLASTRRSATRPAS